MGLGGKSCPSPRYKGMWRSWGIAPLILNLDTKLVWMVGFTLRQLSYRGKSPCYPLHIGLSGPQSRCGFFLEKTNHLPLRNYTAIPWTSNPVNVPTDIPFPILEEYRGLTIRRCVRRSAENSPRLFKCALQTPKQHPCKSDSLLFAKRLRHASINNSSIRFTFLRRFMRSEARFLPPFYYFTRGSSYILCRKQWMIQPYCRSH